MAAIKPEGWLLETAENREGLRTVAGIIRAREEGRTLEGRALICDSGHPGHRRDLPGKQGRLL